MPKGVHGTSGAARIQRSSSSPELPTKASHEVLDHLKQGLHNQSAGDLASKSGGSLSGGGDGTGRDDSMPDGNDASRYTVSSPLSPPETPTSVADFRTPPTKPRAPHGVASGGHEVPPTNLVSRFDASASPSSRVVVGGAGFESHSVVQELMFGSGEGGGVPANSLLSSPMRTRSAENIEGLRKIGELKESIKKDLKDAFSPSSSAPSEVSAASYTRLEKDPAPIAKDMKAVYGIYKNELDVFVEAFGDVLAEKAKDNPEAFHAFFQEILGKKVLGIGYKASMLDRFKDGFPHRLQEISDSLGRPNQFFTAFTPSDNKLNVSVAQKEILHANIAGGNSCIQNMGKTLVTLGQGKMPQNEALIRDIAEILISETNRGELLDPKSGIATLRDAIVASPKLAAVIRELESPLVIHLLANGFDTQTTSVTPLSESPTLEQATTFYQAWKTAAALDILATRPGVYVNRVCEKALYPPASFANFSSISTRKDLDAARSSQSESFETTVATTLAHLQSFLAEPAFSAFTSSLETATKTATETLQSKCTERLEALCKDFRADLPKEIVSTTWFNENDGKAQILEQLASDVSAFSTRYDDLYRAGDTISAEKQLTKDLETFAGSIMKHAANQLIKEFIIAISQGIDGGIGEAQKPESRFIKLFSPSANGSVKAVYDKKLKELQDKLKEKLVSAKEVYSVEIHKLYRAMGESVPANREAMVIKDSVKLYGQSGNPNPLETQLALITADIPKIKALHEAYDAGVSALSACTTAQEVESRKAEILGKLDGVGPETHRTRALLILGRDRIDPQITELKAREATAASQLRTGELRDLETVKNTLGQVLARDTNSMADRRALLQTAVGLLTTVSTETKRLFRDTASKDSRLAHTALLDLSTKVETTYTSFCTTDRNAIMDESARSLGDIATASSSGIDGIAKGLATAHGQKRAAFAEAYTIEGLPSAPLDAGLATLDVFARQLSDAVRSRWQACNSIKAAGRVAQFALTDAVEAAQRDIDFDTVTAQTLRNKTSAFTAACEAAEQGMTTALQGIQPDEDQPQVFPGAVTRAQDELKAHFTAGVLASFAKGKETLSALRDGSLIEDLTAQVPIAVALKNRAEGLRDFLNVGLLDEINGITDAHFARTLTAAEAIANQAMVAAQGFAQTMKGTQPTTETADHLNARMNAFDAAAREALDEFNRAVAGLPEDKKQATRDALKLGIGGIKNSAEAALKTTVSKPLQTTLTAIAALLAAPGATLAQLTAQADIVTQLKDRCKALGDTWLTARLGDEIRGTIEAYESRLKAMRTKAGQIQTLTKALAGLTFTPPAPGTTFEAKWLDIQQKTAQQEAIVRVQDKTILDDPAIKQALSDLEARRTAAIGNHEPEKKALIAGLEGQLDTLAAGFVWDEVLREIETSAMDTFPVADRAEMQAALATAKSKLPMGLKGAVRTRVTAREALTKATASLAGWPASGLSLDTIRGEVATARTTFGAKEPTLLLREWDDATGARVLILEGNLANDILRRDTLISQFQAIQAMNIPNSPPTSLRDRWADIAAQETAFGDLQKPDTAHAAMLVDPQVKEKILAVQIALTEKAKPTGLERAAFRVGMNMALADTELRTADEMLTNAAESVTVAGLVVPALDKFNVAVAAVKVENQKYQGAIAARITYRGHIIAAQGVLAEVQARRATTAQLQTAIGTIEVVPAIVDPGDGTNVFATADAAMAIQKAAIEAGRDRHTELVTAFGLAIATATEQLPDMAANPTAEDKWTALNLANARYGGAVTAGGYLFGNVGVQVHPDIAVSNTAFNTAWNERMTNVAPEVAAIRHEAAESLAAFVAPGSTSTAPVFETLRDRLLNNAGVPAEYKADINKALDTTTHDEILGDLQPRMALHQKILAYDLLSIEKKSEALTTLRSQLKAISTKAIYNKADVHLSDRIDVLETAHTAELAGHATTIQSVVRGHVDRVAFAKTQAAAQSLAEKMSRDIETALAQKMGFTGTAITYSDALLTECKNAVIAATVTAKPKPSLDVQELALAKLDTQLKSNGLTTAITTRLAQRSAIMACQTNPNPATLRVIPATRSDYGVDPNKPFAVLDADYNTEIKRLSDIVTAKKSDLTVAFAAIKVADPAPTTPQVRWAAIAQMETTFAALASAPDNIPYLEDNGDNTAARAAKTKATADIAAAKTDHTLELNTMKASVIAKLSVGGPLDKATVLREAKETATNSIDAAHQALASATLTAAATELKTWYDTKVAPRATWQAAIAAAKGQKAKIESREAKGETLTPPTKPATLPTDGTLFDAYDATMTLRVTALTTFKTTHDAAVRDFNTAIGRATTQLTHSPSPAPATAAAKWTAIKTANTTYAATPGWDSYLFRSNPFEETPIVHPDIQQTLDTFNQEVAAAVNNVAPELAGIRNAAAAALLAFVQPGGTDPEPTFSGLRDGVLEAELNLKGDNLIAVKTAIANDDDGIPAEIKARVDLHKAILAYPTLAPAAKANALEQLQAAALTSTSTSYVAVDGILTANIKALSTATTKDNRSLQSMARTWHSLEESLRTQSNPKAKYTMRLDDALPAVLAAPATAADYISELTATCESLLNAPGLSTDHHAILTRSLAHITNRNTPPPLCAHILSASLWTILGIMDEEVADITDGVITLRTVSTSSAPLLTDVLAADLTLVSNKHIIVPIRPDTDEMRAQLALDEGGIDANVVEVRTWFDAQSADTLGYIDYLGYKAMHADSEDTLNTTLDELSRASALLRNNGTGIETHRTFGDAEAAIRDAKNTRLSFKDSQAQAAEAARLLVEAYNEAMRPVEVAMQHAEDRSTEAFEALASLEAVVGLTPQHGVPPHSTAADTFDMDGFVQLLYSKKALGVTIAVAANRYYASQEDIALFHEAIKITSENVALHTMAETIASDMFRTYLNAPINFGNYIQDVWTEALLASPPIPNAAKLLSDALKYIRRAG